MLLKCINHPKTCCCFICFLYNWN